VAWYNIYIYIVNRYGYTHLESGRNISSSMYFLRARMYRARIYVVSYIEGWDIVEECGLQVPL